MDVLRTPDDRFEGLTGYAFEPHYADVDGLRMHYVDEGPRDGAPVVLLHGEPTWAYLYRTMIPLLAAAGFRVLAIDYVGFGRSDKPSDPAAYTYRAHIDWLRGALDAIGPGPATLFGQDWGGLVGLRLAAEQPERFSRIVAANTFLPTGDPPPPKVWFMFRDMVAKAAVFDVSRTVNAGTVTALSPEVRAGYDAPFPDESFKTGARRFPQIVPTSPDDPEAAANVEAWKTLDASGVPLLTIWGGADPIMKGANRPFMRLAGAQGQPHSVIDEAGHFIQEDAGPEVARRMIDWR